MFDELELEQISQTWGFQFADALMSDRSWPTCDQQSTIRAAILVVDHAITGIVAILNEGPDFRPHLEMIARTTRSSFRSSLPHGGIH